MNCPDTPLKKPLQMAKRMFHSHAGRLTPAPPVSCLKYIAAFCFLAMLPLPIFPRHDARAFSPYQEAAGPGSGGQYNATYTRQDEYARMPSTGRQPVIIGGLWDMSGAGSLIGQAAFRGARLAVHNININGGINGRRLNLTAADTTGSAAVLLEKASRMVNREGCSVIMGPVHPAFCRTIRGFAEAHRIPLFLTAGDEPIMRLRGYAVDWTFSVSPPITAQSRRLFYRLKRRGAIPVGIIASNDSLGQRTALWIKGYAQEYQILTGELQGFANTDTDIVAQIKTLRGQGAVTIFIWGQSGIVNMVANSMRRLPGTYAVPCILLDDSLMGAVQAGATIVASLPPVLMRESLPSGHPSETELASFMKAMAGETEYMTLQEIMAAGAAWDAVKLSAMAIKAGGNSRTGIRNALEEAELEYAGVMGVFSPTKRDHCGINPLSLVPAVPSGSGWRNY